uniref:N5-carboxyaminoimidazole ribonucleotide mutase n=1 Tax=Candidatus Methanomethylicus mesodigestus TaxID=1867258 RepID=A0A7C3J423_9CREN
MPKVAVIIGSKSDEKLGLDLIDFLRGYEIDCSLEVISAHRNPEKLDRFIRNSDAEVFIAIAGLAAALPGVIASKTIRPVIGVPREVKLGGLDSLLSIVQMPPGIPVATVGIDNWKNAGVLALEILALKHREIAERLVGEREGSK